MDVESLCFIDFFIFSWRSSIVSVFSIWRRTRLHPVMYSSPDCVEDEFIFPLRTIVFISLLTKFDLAPLDHLMFDTSSFNAWMFTHFLNQLVHYLWDSPNLKRFVDNSIYKHIISYVGYSYFDKTKVVLHEVNTCGNKVPVDIFNRGFFFFWLHRFLRRRFFDVPKINAYQHLPQHVTKT